MMRLFLSLGGGNCFYLSTLWQSQSMIAAMPAPQIRQFMDKSP
jgi:hypothetical protein